MKSYFINLGMMLFLAHVGHAVLVAFVANRGSLPIEAEYWVRDELMFKQSLADRAGDGRRILILSGSNGLFGFDSGLIERRTGLKTINLSTHGGLPLDFQLDYADKMVRDGDLIILPLEYEYYPQPPGQSSAWWWQMALAVFPEVFRELPMADRLRALLHLKPQMLWGGAYVSMRRLVQPDFMEQRSLPDVQSIMLKWKNAPHTGSTQYGVEGTDEHGDIERNCGSKNSIWNYPIATSSFNVNLDAVNALKRYFARWKERGVGAYVSFPPVSIDVMASPHFQENAGKLSMLLEKSGIATLGQPSDFVFPRKAFFDTPYHLNCDGRVERTLILLRHLLVSKKSAESSSKCNSGLVDLTRRVRLLVNAELGYCQPFKGGSEGSIDTGQFSPNRPKYPARRAHMPRISPRPG